MGMLLERATGLARWLVEPLLRFDFIDRSLALGAQAFSALIPLMILLQAAQPGSDTMASSLIERFDLTDEAAATVREAFAVSSDQTTITGVSVLVLLVSVLSFTRRLQRLYEGTWGYDQRGFRGSGWGLAWIAFLALYATVQPALDDALDGLLGSIVSFAGVFGLGLVTPYLLLGRRLEWRRLVLQGLLTAVGLTALGIWSAIYMPAAIGSSAAAYGSIGVAFAMLTWLWGLGMVLVAAAVFGSPQISWPPGSPRAGDGSPPRSG